ncbi:hypothetical protein GCM10010388_00100 [Streptomyces mauvecolor]
MNPHRLSAAPSSRGAAALSSNPRTWSDIFTTTIDALPVECVRDPNATLPTWGLYTPGRYRLDDYLGTLHIRDTDNLWHVQATGENHVSFSDAVRALRRPPTWHEDRARAAGPLTTPLIPLAAKPVPHGLHAGADLRPLPQIDGGGGDRAHTPCGSPRGAVAQDFVDRRFPFAWQALGP